VFDEPVEQAGQLSSHRGDGFGSAQTRTQTAVLRSQITLAAEQGGRCVPERHGGPIHHLSCAAVQDFASALLVGRTQSQPAGELFLAGKGAQVRAGLRDHGLRRQNIDAVDLCPVDARNAI